MTDPVRQRDILRHLVEQQPGFAPAWFKWAELADDSSARLEAIERGLAANPDAETRGMPETNKALTLVAAGDREGAIGLLRELVTNSASSSSTEALARDALTRLGANASP